MKKERVRIDAVALMREIRDRMSAEIEGMTYEQEKAYLREGREDKPEVCPEERREAV